jgi:membrane-bound lytic murein transglycosylase D
MGPRSFARVLFTAGLISACVLGTEPALAQAAAGAPKPVAPAAAKPKPAAKKAPAKPAPKPAAKKGDKGGAKKPPSTRKPGEAGEPDENARRVIAGAAPTPGRSVEESPELKAMRELDLALFSAAPSSGPAWPSDDLPRLEGDDPVLVASGMPPSAPAPAAHAPDAPQDLSWLRKLQMPDIPVRWDARVVRYLEFYKNTSRGRAMVATWIKKSGRYGASIRRVLREQGLPEDIVWLALVESGFDPTIHSPVGAAGLWQFMPEGARIYGLTVDRWIDERLDPERATLAAARYLSDLRRRFGSWELAFAAYNMGYGGLLASIRKYNTNDFWELSRLEAGMPLETALYVPKIVSLAIVARNCAVFGCDTIELDPAVTFDKVAVGAGVALRTVAAAAGSSEDAVLSLNPQLPAGRTPPLPPDAKDGASFTVRVPAGTGSRAAKGVAPLLEREEKLERYVVRWGESLEDIATSRRTTKSSLVALNGLRRDELVRPGAVLLVPSVPAAADATPAETGDKDKKPVLVVPAEAFSYPDRRRVFYRVAAGDTAREVAAALGVTAPEICRWNAIDPGAALHDGMTLQVFVPKERAMKNALVLEEADARVLPVGSPEFFTHFEALKGRKRMEIVAAEGDSWRGLSKRFGLSLGMLERINHRSRTSPLVTGDKVVVYVPSTNAAPATRPTEPGKERPEDKGEVVVAVAKPVEDRTPASDEIADKDEEAVTKPAVLRSERSEEPRPADPPVAEKPAASKPADGAPADGRKPTDKPAAPAPDKEKSGQGA